MPDWLIQLGGMLVTGGMAWGAIRADLKAIHERIVDLKDSAKEAHKRLDDHLTDYHRS